MKDNGKTNMVSMLEDWVSEVPIVPVLEELPEVPEEWVPKVPEFEVLEESPEMPEEWVSKVPEELEAEEYKEDFPEVQEGNYMLCDNILKTYLGGEESVTIPNTVEVINDSAFARCHELISVEIPDSVKEIRDYAFAVCNGLQEVTLPQNVKLGKNVFHECTELNVIKIRFPGGVVGTFGKEALDAMFQKI